MNLVTLVVRVRLLALKIVAHVLLRQVTYNRLSVDYVIVLTVGI